MEETGTTTKKRRVWPRRLAWAVGILVVLGLAAFLARNIIVRAGVETAVTRATGFPLEMGGFDLGIFDSRVEIRDLRLFNPEGFEDRRCLHAPRIVADVEAGSLFDERFHAEEVVLEVAEIVVVRNAKGETNLDRLAALKEKASDTVTDGGEKEFLWKCDLLRLSIGKVVFLDYTRARDGKPKEEVYELDIDKEFRNITEPGQIVRILVLEVITGSPIRLLGVTVDKLREGLGGVVDGAGTLLKGAGNAVIGVVEGVGEAIGGIFGGGKKEPEPPKEPKPPEKPR